MGRFESYLVENPEDRFSRDEAHFKNEDVEFEQRQRVIQRMQEQHGVWVSFGSKKLGMGGGWLCMCFTALPHILGHFGRGQLT